MSADAPSYVERPADKQLLKALLQSQVCLVPAPRQSGKSSLMVQTRKKLIKKGVSVAIVDLQSVGTSLPNMEKWFSNICFQIHRDLNIDIDLSEWWDSQSPQGPTQKFTNYLEDIVAPNGEEVVIFFDEIDSALSLPFSDDFFTTIRAIYNKRSTRINLRRLTFTLLGTTTTSELIKDRDRTSFNIGTTIHLTDFTEEDIVNFSKILGKDSIPLLKRIFYWTSGQPYLVQLLALNSSNWPKHDQNASNLDLEVENLFFKKAISQNVHLSYIERVLTDIPNSNLKKETLQVYQKLLKGKSIPFQEVNTTHNLLELSGITKRIDGKLSCRNKIYTTVFNHKWVTAQIPIYSTREYLSSIEESDSNVIFTIGSRGAGKSSFLATLLTYLKQTHRLEFNTQYNKEGLAHLINMIDNLQNGVLPEPSSIGFIEEIDIKFSNKGVDTILTFLDASGEDHQQIIPGIIDPITGSPSSGILDEKLSRYLKRKDLKVTLLCFIDYRTPQKDDFLIALFLNYIVKNFNFDLSRMAIIVTKWDLNTEGISLYGFLSNKAPQSFLWLKEYANAQNSNAFPFSVGKINANDFRQIEFLDFAYCSDIVDWLTYVSANQQELPTLLIPRDKRISLKNLSDAIKSVIYLKGNITGLFKKDN